MTKFNEMIYQNRMTYKILALGEFDNYEYKIVSMGTHPCAYVKLSADNIYYRHSYRNIPIYVHGGLKRKKTVSGLVGIIRNVVIIPIGIKVTTIKNGVSTKYLKT